MSNGRRPRWSQELEDTVTGVCERSVKGIAGLFKWDEKRAHNLIRGDGQGCDRPCPFMSLRLAQALCWFRIAGVPLQVLKSAAASYYTFMLRSLSCLALMNGMASFTPRKVFSSSRKWGKIIAAGAISARSFV